MDWDHSPSPSLVNAPFNPVTAQALPTMHAQPRAIQPRNSGYQAGIALLTQPPPVHQIIQTPFAASLCQFCRGGGIVIECVECHQTTCCTSHGFITGCLPTKVDPDSWTCWTCLDKVRKPFPYPEPPRAVGGARSLMDTNPLVLFNVYSAGYQEEAAVALLRALAKSRFTGDPDRLLIVQVRYEDLHQQRRFLERGRKDMVDFVARFTKLHLPVRLVMTIHTHTTPEAGLVVYRAMSSVSLSGFLEFTIGSLNLELFSNSILFVVTCGGLVKHSLDDIRQASLSFRSVYAFGAPNIDPITVTAFFVQSMLLHHIFSCLDVDDAVERAIINQVMFETSVYVASQKGRVVKFENSPLRHRPNGEDEYCCNRLMDFKDQSHGSGQQWVRMVCKAPNHPEGQSKTRKIFIQQTDLNQGFEVIDAKRFSLRVLAREVT